MQFVLLWFCRISEFGREKNGNLPLDHGRLQPKGRKNSHR